MADEVLSWVDPAGVVTVLTDQPDIEVEWGLLGRFMPPSAMVEDDAPGQAGSLLRQVRVRPREVTLPVTVFGADFTELRTRMRSWLRLFDPTRGDGRLRATAPDGAVRELTCRYTTGLEGLETFEHGFGHARMVLVLRAHDPFWYDTAPQSQTYTTGAQPVFFSDPFFGSPKLASDTILGTQTVSNGGDVEAWPVWTVHGPASSITLSNDTTGQTVDLPVTLTAAQTVVIDTRPFRKTVLRDDGTNLYGSLSNTSSLWSLPTGDSTVTISLPGATSESYVTLVYARRWLSP
jgi:phage-related protein